jgi:hypothetical protein
MSRGRAVGTCLVTLGLVVAAVSGIAGAFREPGREAQRGPAAGGSWVPRRETRPTLDPARFVGKAALAHQVARDIPEVLDQLYCYCHCDRSVGHKSLLSCYTDGHAAT